MRSHQPDARIFNRRQLSLILQDAKKRLLHHVFGIIGMSQNTEATGTATRNDGRQAGNLRQSIRGSALALANIRPSVHVKIARWSLF